MAEKRNDVNEETTVEEDAAAEAVAETPAPAAEEIEAEAPAPEPVAEAPADDEPEAAADDEPATGGTATAPAETPEPVPATAPAASEPAAESTPAPQSGPKPKRKRLPRALRPQRTRPTRVKATERKPIVRLEKPEHERNRRQERQGTVVSDAMEKTIVVRVDTVKAHPRYKKVVRQSAKFHAHDEQGRAKVGDLVRIVETRPLSKTKRWRLAEVVEAAK